MSDVDQSQEGTDQQATARVLLMKNTPYIEAVAEPYKREEALLRGGGSCIRERIPRQIKTWCRIIVRYTVN